MNDPRIRSSQRFETQDAKGNVISHVDIIAHGDVLWVDNLWVDGAYRKQGLAKALMDEMLRWYDHIDLYLEVLPYTDRAMDREALTLWYATFGFRPTSVPGVMLRTAAAAPPPLATSTMRIVGDTTTLEAQ